MASELWPLRGGLILICCFVMTLAHSKRGRKEKNTIRYRNGSMKPITVLFQKQVREK
jgi:hypothetical protein